MATLEDYGDAMSTLWGLVLLILIVFSLVGALVLLAQAVWRFVRDRLQVRRFRVHVRRRSSTEALEQALRRLGQENRAAVDAEVESAVRASGESYDAIMDELLIGRTDGPPPIGIVTDPRVIALSVWSRRRTETDPRPESSS